MAPLPRLLRVRPSSCPAKRAATAPAAAATHLLGAQLRSLAAVPIAVGPRLGAVEVEHAVQAAQLQGQW